VIVSTVELTANAARRIAHLMSADETPNAKLRISVNGGGCSGFQYAFDFVYDNAEPTDLVINKDGAIVLIDDVSLPFMDNAVIDYVESLGAAHFEIKNPNASAKCGCGNSFAV
jgi:iron-sulfur cluster assembly accessory protein